MQDAYYFRSQAELCLAIAKQMSDRGEAERLRARAAEYAARAAGLEGQGQSPDQSESRFSPSAQDAQRGDDA